MGIYPVRISEWFPLGDEHHENATMMVSVFRCLACDKKLRWKAAIGHHSIPWGHGDLWCGWKCCRSGKVARPDKRRERRYRRKAKDLYCLIDTK